MSQSTELLDQWLTHREKLQYEALRLDEYDVEHYFKMEQNTEEWRNARKIRLTASDAAKVLDLSEYGDSDSLIKSKFTEPIETDAMRRGREIEPHLKNLYVQFMKVS